MEAKLEITMTEDFKEEVKSHAQDLGISQAGLFRMAVRKLLKTETEG